MAAAERKTVTARGHRETPYLASLAVHRHHVLLIFRQEVVDVLAKAWDHGQWAGVVVIEREAAYATVEICRVVPAQQQRIRHHRRHQQQ